MQLTFESGQPPTSLENHAILGDFVLHQFMEDHREFNQEVPRFECRDLYVGCQGSTIGEVSTIRIRISPSGYITGVLSFKSLSEPQLHKLEAEMRGPELFDSVPIHLFARFRDKQSLFAVHMYSLYILQDIRDWKVGELCLYSVGKLVVDINPAPPLGMLRRTKI